MKLLVFLCFFGLFLTGSYAEIFVIPSSVEANKLIDRTNDACEVLRKYGLEPPAESETTHGLLRQFCGQQFILDYLTKNSSKGFINGFYTYCSNHPYRQKIHKFCDQVDKIFVAKSEANAICRLPVETSNEFPEYRIERRGKSNEAPDYRVFKCNCKKEEPAYIKVEDQESHDEKKEHCTLVPMEIEFNDENHEPMMAKVQTCRVDEAPNTSKELPVRNAKKRKYKSGYNAQAVKCQKVSVTMKLANRVKRANSRLKRTLIECPNFFVWPSI